MAKTGLFGSQLTSGSRPSMFGRGTGGILPERGSARQLDLVTSLAQSVGPMAAQSGSPLLAFMAPLVAGGATTRATSLFNEAQQGRDQAAMASLLQGMPPSSTARATDLAKLMMDPNLSPQMRQTASTMFNQTLADHRSAQRGGGAAPAEWRAATAEEAAAYGAGAGQFGPNGRFYPMDVATDPAAPNAGIMRQQNEAAAALDMEISERVEAGQSYEEAVRAVTGDPIYSPYFKMIDIDPAEYAREAVKNKAARDAEAAARQEEADRARRNDDWNPFNNVPVPATPSTPAPALPPGPAPAPAPTVPAAPVTAPPPPPGFTEDF